MTIEIQIAYYMNYKKCSKLDMYSECIKKSNTGNMRILNHQEMPKIL